MDDFIRCLLECSKKMETVSMEGTGIVTAHACYLFDIHLSGGAGAIATAEFHKGTRELTIPTIYLYTIASTSFNYWWYPPIHCPDGIYYKKGGTVTGCFFHFLRADR